MTSNFAPGDSILYAMNATQAPIRRVSHCSRGKLNTRGGGSDCLAFGCLVIPLVTGEPNPTKSRNAPSGGGTVTDGVCLTYRLIDQERFDRGGTSTAPRRSGVLLHQYGPVDEIFVRCGVSVYRRCIPVTDICSSTALRGSLFLPGPGATFRSILGHV